MNMLFLETEALTNAAVEARKEFQEQPISARAATALDIVQNLLADEDGEVHTGDVFALIGEMERMFSLFVKQEDIGAFYTGAVSENEDESDCDDELTARNHPDPGVRAIQAMVDAAERERAIAYVNDYFDNHFGSGKKLVLGMKDFKDV